ncbi:MAG: molecular chaperone [Rhodomicrobium sp.]
MRIVPSAVVPFAFLALCGPCPQALALGVTPLVIELSSGAANRSAQIVVNNDGASSTPIEIQVLRAELDENGHERVTPAPADFVIFPPSKILAPHSKQVFKIQWAGAPLAKSQTYALVVDQLPVAMPEATSGLQVVFNFEVIANVSPPSGTRSLDLVSSSVVTVNGKRFASLLLSNAGNMHAKLSDANVTLQSGSWSKTISSADLQQRLGVAIVQPGKKRRFLIPVELPDNANAVRALISYEPALR